MSAPYQVMIVAGEASGDLHAANLIRELLAKAPGTQVSGMGGAKLREVGVELIVDSSNLAVIGFIEVLAHYREIKAALRTLQSAVLERRPDLLILVDYVGFNLRLAETAKRAGIKVLFYVSPQVWAWRPHRVKKIGECVDMMAVLFPFEAQFYERHGIPVRYVGHPLLEHAKPQRTREQALQAFGLEADRPVVGLLPGSRRGEIKRLMPILMAAADELRRRLPAVQFVLPLASSLSEADLAPYAPQSHGVRVVSGQSYDVMNAADALITASGTATLEAALIGTPMVIVYKISLLSYWIMKRLILIEHVGLANIVAGERVVRELLQHDARPDLIADEVEHILTDGAYEAKIREGLKRVRTILERSDDQRTVADLALEMLAGKV